MGAKVVVKGDHGVAVLDGAAEFGQHGGPDPELAVRGHVLFALDPAGQRGRGGGPGTQ